jgi:hypothetical protein
MKRLAATLVLVFPVCASADLVQVEYEAVVNSVTRNVCACDPTRGYSPDNPEYTGYSVGDRIHGFLSIDLTAAPADREPLNPSLGVYFAESRSGGFISGNGDPLVHLVFQDSVSVFDGDAASGSPFDEHYIITDQWRTQNGTGQMGVVMISRDANVDLVTGDGIAQSIDVRPRAGLELLGYIDKVVRSGAHSVAVSFGLLFDHVTVTPPRTCKA